ncbi:MAG TPA: adenylate/guanylate cyclase domain-containing protein [Desulfobacteraceae bacterium]|nr:adenylate/guanylate cyclase domain-containing protein [Desulfobacteraceae bacterium]
MNDRDITRKLAAIVSMDVKDYSRLMSDDDVRTVRMLKACRRLMADKIQVHRGRVVDSPGDNLLSEFPSVADAVQCAVSIQSALYEKNKELPPKHRMEFRIGINLGDVIQDGDQIYGDGLNIAARLEGIAPGGGICISGSAFDQVKKLLPLGYEFLGEKDLKNISDKVPVYRVITDPAKPGEVVYACSHHNPKARRRKRFAIVLFCVLLGAGLIVAKHIKQGTVPHQGPSKLKSRIKEKLVKLREPEKPSLAVLPFTNMSRDPDQEYFSDGLTEDLITDLSQISGLFVIARNSVFTYKGRAVEIEEVGEELGVRYVLEGSVRKVGNRVRITAQLIDAETEGHVWAQRYDRDLADIFSVQDEVRRKIVTALAVELSSEDQQRMTRDTKVDVEAYDFYLKGVEFQANKMKDGIAKAREMYQAAVDLDPGYARAWAALGHTILIEWIFGTNTAPRALEKAHAMAEKAIEVDPEESAGYSLLGHVFLWTHQHEDGIKNVRKAISLEPGNAEWLAALGEQLTWAGYPEEGITYIEQAMRLDPKYPAWYLWNLGHAYFLTGTFDRAVDIFQRALVKDPYFWPAHAYLALSYDAMNLPEKAREEAIVATQAPVSQSICNWEDRLPYKDKALASQLIERMTALGME